MLDVKFSSLEGGGGMGVPSWKILKTKRAGEAISGHFFFVGAILPSVNEEFQRILLPCILYALFKYKI